jgi:hypothetical protein
MFSFDEREKKKKKECYKIIRPFHLCSLRVRNLAASDSLACVIAKRPAFKFYTCSLRFTLQVQCSLFLLVRVWLQRS